MENMMKDKITFTVDRDDVKAAVCNFIDNGDWSGARLLLDGAKVMEGIQERIQESFREVEPDGRDDETVSGRPV